jgi:hypothetical protein
MQGMPDVMAWLDADVPLTLVMDLLDETGPNSQRILRAERPAPAQLAWLSSLDREVRR